MDRLLLHLRKASGALLFVILTLLSIAISFLISKAGAGVAYAFIVFIIGVAVVLITFSNFRIGFFIMVAYSFFFFFIGRMLPVPIPLGVFMEFFYVLISISIFLYKHKATNRNEDLQTSKGVFNNPIGYAILFYIGYALVEMINPNSTAIAPRALAIREMLALVLLFFIAMHVFKTYQYIDIFTKFWLFLALIVALYGFYQEYVGLQDFEMRWLYASPERFKLAFIWGRMRKWSFLSDISAFGLFSAYSGIICGILALGPFKFKNRLVLGVSALLIFISMTFSGTRTATVMVVIGFIFYILLTINNRKTLIFASSALIVFLAILYGPFYGSSLTRLRSAFNPSEDASMGVRNYKRAWLQPYAREHPIGGGINTVGSVGIKMEPKHPLAGDYDPDSGYLRMALERGWIGLLVNFGLYASILIFGIKNYYKVKNQKFKILFAAYMSGFFSLTIANFAQDAMDQKPIIVIILCSYAIFVRLSEFDQFNHNTTTTT